MLLLTPSRWKDYELLDCGDFQKLERFGSCILIRPEPQAVWAPKASMREWEEKAHVRFLAKSSSSGAWKKFKPVPDRWNIQYHLGNKNLHFRLAMTGFKHVGIFPEQAVNWDYIYQNIQTLKTGTSPKFLNLFAYTGAASIAAKAAGADVTHLDAVKQVVTWARENMELSHLKDIRWIVEDALRFVKREVKRGNKYHGIILDPPAYGHGTDGEKWKLEDNILEMVSAVTQLLMPEKNFIILNAYSLGFSSIILENLLSPYAGKNLETGELYLRSASGNKLPLGVFGRWKSGF